MPLVDSLVKSLHAIMDTTYATRDACAGQHMLTTIYSGAGQYVNLCVTQLVLAMSVSGTEIQLITHPCLVFKFSVIILNVYQPANVYKSQATMN